MGSRLSMLGLSGAVHAALFLTPLGHPNVGRPASPALTLVDVDVEPPLTPPLPEVDAPVENRATAMPTHTHPYPVPASHDFTPHDPSLVHVMAPATPHDEHEEHVHEAPSAADTSTTLTATTSAPRFTLAMSFGASGAGGVTSSERAPGHSDGDDDGVGGAVAERFVDTPARLLRGTTPSYPSQARAEGIEAEVKLELVVSSAGAVEDAKVTRRAGYGLDEAAMVAARQFRFTPASRHGQPVRVRMSWAVEFRLN